MFQKYSKYNLPLKVGIGLVILVTVFLLFKIDTSDQSKELYQEYYNQHPRELTTVQPTHTVDLDNAMKAFSKKDFNQALEMFSKIEILESTRLYEAICLMELGKQEEAQSMLFSLLHSKNKSLKENAEWYLALSFLHSHKNQRAINQLNPISHDTSHLFKRNAKALLTRLMKN